MRSLIQPKNPKNLRIFNQHVQGGGRRFSQNQNLPMQLKACGHSYSPKPQKPPQLQSACARRGETFLSKAIRKCCLKHAVPKPTRPSFIISHHEPSGETFFQRPVAPQPKHKNNRHAPNKCKKPQKRKTAAKTRQPFTSTKRSIVSPPTRISFITV